MPQFLKLKFPGLTILMKINNNPNFTLKLSANTNSKK
jgi:hypothetical protein